MAPLVRTQARQVPEDRLGEITERIGPWIDTRGEIQPGLRRLRKGRAHPVQRAPMHQIIPHGHTSGNNVMTSRRASIPIARR